ncbi:hypothetical protein OAL12_00345 [Akkermansiaceae bacterium]|nr:hypothetical protein [Akkermansiaceae bacterium]MDA7871127.1 hypothetical protein [Akkermansiaceae bacterium]MDA7875352.1 hypothetical protein [Akkermansiaceae bacterium]MDC0301395.1 hypothetical protein [Akkermansiaceae bacterium]
MKTQSRNNTVVALDFDGVVCDSINECLVTGYNAWGRLFGNEKRWATSYNDVPLALRESFRVRRYFVRPAKHYGLLINELLHGRYPRDQISFDLLAKKTSLDLDAFESTFFECREELRRQDIRAWMDLHRLYPFNNEWFAKMESSSVHVVTTKDAQSVRELNRHFGLGFDETLIWDKDRTEDKSQAILQIAEIHQCDTKDIIFVDDHPDHLALVKENTKAKCFWASWGYTPRDAVFFGPDFFGINSLSESNK